MGKQLLPRLGGAPAVWNVCLLFFQSALLAGYAVAHGVARLRSRAQQLVLFGALLLGASATLPVAFSSEPGVSDRPVLWLLGQLGVEAGLPFLALVAATPLFQHWYERSASSGDPYVLYAASNAGSLGALLAFPVWLEARWTVGVQNRIWTASFWLALVLVAGAAWLSRRQAQRSLAGAEVEDASAALTSQRPVATTRTLLRWLTLAFAPSSLLLGVTSFLTTDLAPVPLLWVIPLALYLLTFVIAFSVMREGPARWLLKFVGALAVGWVFVYRLQLSDPLWLLLLLHLGFFTAIALACHSRVAALRPPPIELTRFYLVIAAGGALGGAFNTLLAPLLFDGHAEYPLIVLLALALILVESPVRARLRDDLWPAALLLAAMLALLALDFWPRHLRAAAIITVILPLLVACFFARQPIRFILVLAAILATMRADRTLSGRLLFAERNFFGVLRVSTDARGRYHELRHGTTLHGAADITQVGGSRPLTYFSYRSPGTDVLRSIQEQVAQPRVGVVGLGAGSLAWYARPGEAWTFFEINPAVAELARDPALFDYLHRSRAEPLTIRLGDARLELQKLPDASFDLLILDAFASDAIPVHLLTREAVQLYLRKLTDRGVIAFHISNRYLDLTPVLADLASALHLRARARADLNISLPERAHRIEPSMWVALARTDADFGATLFAGTWYVPARGRARVWTDDYSNVWSALVW